MTYDRPPPMTSTTSGAATRVARNAAVSSTEPGADGRLRGPRADGRGQRGGTGDGGIRIAAGPDVRDDGPVGGGQHLGEGIQHGRGPVVRQRLVDRPDPPAGMRVAHGSQGGRDGRRVVAVVVDDQHPLRLALDLHPPADTPEAGEPTLDVRRGDAQDQRRTRDADRIRGVVTASETGSQADRGPLQRPAPGRRPGPGVRRRQQRRRPSSASTASARPTRTTRPGQSPSRSSNRRTPGSPMLATRVRVLGARERAASPRTRRGPRPGPRTRPGRSHSALSSTATSGRYASKLPAYSSASTTNAATTPPPCGRRQATGDGGRQQRAHERGGIGAGRRSAGGPASPRRSTCRGCPRCTRGGRPGSARRPR